MSTLNDLLKHHVTGAIERGKSFAIVEKTSNYTPGPWRVLDRPENAQENFQTLTHITNGAHIVCTLGSTKNDGSPNHYVNANLLAAAPDLLSALEKLLSRCSSLDQSATHDGLKNCEAIASARAAISKAKWGK